MNAKNSPKTTSIAIIMVCLTLAGCASSSPPTPTSTPPPQPPIAEATAIAPTEMTQVVATSTATSVPIPTQAPSQPNQTELLISETPVPTATNYPEPAVSLSPTGPWLVFKTWTQEDMVEEQWWIKRPGYLWAINQDGTGLTRLTNELVSDYEIQPGGSIQSGLTIAYASTNYSEKTDRHESEIKLLSWPGGDVKTIVYNLADRELLWGRLPLVWSPGGSKLAFISTMDDASSNVFVYDTATEESTRIAVTEYNDCCLGWSPDERYVIFESYHRGMVLVKESNAVWSARADASGITQLVDAFGVSVEYLGWLSPTEIILYISRWSEQDSEVRITNVETGQYVAINKEPLLDVAYSPEHNIFLMTKEVAPAPNQLLIFYENGERREVAGYAIKHVRWLSAYGVFLGQTSSGRAYLITPDGEVTEIPTPEWSSYDANSINYPSVSISPDNQWWVWQHSRESGSGREYGEIWVGPALAPPSLHLSEYPHFSPDSQYVLWKSKENLYIASPPNFDVILERTCSGDCYWVWSPDSKYLFVFDEGILYVTRPPNFEALPVAEFGDTYLSFFDWIH